MLISKNTTNVTVFDDKSNVNKSLAVVVRSFISLDSTLSDTSFALEE